jgi:hypothetical protein
LAEPERRGILHVREGRIGSGISWPRRAVELSVPLVERLVRHREVLAVLRGRPGTDPALLVHHAVHGRDAAAVVDYGPAAARDAARSSAHQETLAHYETVLGRRTRSPRWSARRILDRIARDGRRPCSSRPAGSDSGFGLRVAAAPAFLHSHIYWPVGGLAMLAAGLGCGLLEWQHGKPA